MLYDINRLSLALVFIVTLTLPLAMQLFYRIPKHIQYIVIKTTINIISLVINRFQKYISSHKYNLNNVAHQIQQMQSRIDYALQNGTDDDIENAKINLDYYIILYDKLNR